jgi:hypothetical protein
LAVAAAATASEPLSTQYPNSAPQPTTTTHHPPSAAATAVIKAAAPPKRIKISKRPPVWQLVPDSIYTHREKKVLDEDDIMICHCKHIWATDTTTIGCGEACLNRMLNIECVPEYCPSGDRCTNRMFTKREYAKLDVKRAGAKGFGLFAAQDIKAGQFVIHYVGEVLEEEEYIRRKEFYIATGQRHYYFMNVGNGEVIDACRKGGIGRFINHSCDPNCETQKWVVQGELSIGLFAVKDITAGTELTFDYNFERYGDKPLKCLCGTKVCRGFIGGTQESITAAAAAQAISLEDQEEEDPEPIMVTEKESDPALKTILDRAVGLMDKKAVGSSKVKKKMVQLASKYNMELIDKIEEEEEEDGEEGEEEKDDEPVESTRRGVKGEDGDVLEEEDESGSESEGWSDEEAAAAAAETAAWTVRNKQKNRGKQTTNTGGKKAAAAAAVNKVAKKALVRKKEGDSDWEKDEYDDDKAAARLEQEERKQRLKTLVASKTKGSSASSSASAVVGGKKISSSASTGLLRPISSSKAFTSSGMMAGFKRRTEIDRKLEMMLGPSGRLRPEYMEKKPIIDFLRLFNLCDISSDRPQQMNNNNNNTMGNGNSMSGAPSTALPQSTTLNVSGTGGISSTTTTLGGGDEEGEVIIAAPRTGPPPPPPPPPCSSSLAPRQRARVADLSLLLDVVSKTTYPSARKLFVQCGILTQIMIVVGGNTGPEFGVILRKVLKVVDSLPLGPHDVYVTRSAHGCFADVLRGLTQHKDYEVRNGGWMLLKKFPPLANNNNNNNNNGGGGGTNQQQLQQQQREGGGSGSGIVGAPPPPPPPPPPRTSYPPSGPPPAGRYDDNTTTTTTTNGRGGYSNSGRYDRYDDDSSNGRMRSRREYDYNDEYASRDGNGGGSFNKRPRWSEDEGGTGGDGLYSRSYYNGDRDRGGGGGGIVIPPPPPPPPRPPGYQQQQQQRKNSNVSTETMMMVVGDDTNKRRPSRNVGGLDMSPMTEEEEEDDDGDINANGDDDDDDDEEGAVGYNNGEEPRKKRRINDDDGDDDDDANGRAQQQNGHRHTSTRHHSNSHQQQQETWESPDDSFTAFIKNCVSYKVGQYVHPDHPSAISKDEADHLYSKVKREVLEKEQLAYKERQAVGAFKLIERGKLERKVHEFIKESVRRLIDRRGTGDGGGGGYYYY